METLTQRKIQSGANVTLSVLLALGCWALVGWLNARHYVRYDWTANKTFSLSEKTVSILQGLQDSITVTTLFRPGSSLDGQVKDLLEEYADKSGKITLVRIDPDKDAAKVELMAKRLNLNSFQVNSVIFETGGKTKQVTHGEIEEREPSPNPLIPSKAPPKFKGEEAFTSAILNLTEGKAPAVFFTTGHGEKDVEGTDRMAVSELVKLLRRENCSVNKLQTLQEGDIPAHADALIIVSPRQKFLPVETDKLDVYLQRGGKLLVLLDPLSDSGLEPLLRKWGVEADNNMVLDPVLRLSGAGPTTLVVYGFGVHPITDKLKGSAVLLSLARSVRPAPDAGDSAVVLLAASKEAWGETDMMSKQAQFDPGKDLQGPVSLGVAVAKKFPGAKPGDPAVEARLVVLGDSDFLTNLQLSNGGNMDLFSNAVNWLVSREKMISIGPKIAEVPTVTVNAAQMKMILWFTVIIMPLAAIAAGVAVWYRRRR